jgi:hypothetical protein
MARVDDQWSTIFQTSMTEYERNGETLAAGHPLAHALLPFDRFNSHESRQITGLKAQTCPAHPFVLVVAQTQKAVPQRVSNSQ